MTQCDSAGMSQLACRKRLESALGAHPSGCPSGQVKQAGRLAVGPARLSFFNKRRHALAPLIAQHAVGKTGGSKI